VADGADCVAAALLCRQGEIMDSLAIPMIVGCRWWVSPEAQFSLLKHPRDAI
jgi:hypothetical protein